MLLTTATCFGPDGNKNPAISTDAMNLSVPVPALRLPSFFLGQYQLHLVQERVKLAADTVAAIVQILEDGASQIRQFGGKIDQIHQFRR